MPEIPSGQVTPRVGILEDAAESIASSDVEAGESVRCGDRLGQRAQRCRGAERFIGQDGDRGDVFVHSSAIQSGGYRSLDENQRVEFEVVQGLKDPQAEQVRAI